MKYLITGAYGFLGYSLAVRLLEGGHEVVGIDRVNNAISEKKPRIQNLAKYPGFRHEECDLVNYKAMEMIFRNHSPQRIMHFAAQYAVAPLNPELLQRYMDSNCTGFSNVLQASQVVGADRFTYASSTFVEDHVRSTHTYGATKKFNEEMANVFSHTHGMDTIGIRYGSTFGKYCRQDVGAYKAAKRMFDGQQHPMKGGYLYKTAFLWAEDAVQITADLMEKPMPDKWNAFTLVMNDSRYSLTDIARMMHDYAEIPLVFMSEPPPDVDGGVPEPQLQQLEAVLGYRPPTTMQDAVVKFVDWFKGRYEAGKA